MFKNLRALRESLGLNQSEFSEQIGRAPNTYNNYELQNREPNSDFWIAISDKYHVSIDYLLGQTDDKHGTKYGGRSELDEKYAALDEHGRRLVDAIIEIEASRSKTQPIIEVAPKTKIIPLFPAAAGPGDQQDGNAFESHEVPFMSKADFAIRISGDSMEPELHHGDIVLCKKRQPIDGELAAVMVNGFLYVKQVEHDKYGGLHLLSINRERKSLDVHIYAESTDTVKIYGTLFHRFMPPIKWRE